MSFDPVKFAIVTSVQGFTLWHYDTDEEPQQLLDPGYFAPASGMLRRGDLVFCSCLISGARKTCLLLVDSVKDGQVVVEPLQGDASSALANLGAVTISGATAGEVLTFANGAWTNQGNPGAAGDAHAVLSGNPHGATAADLGAIAESTKGQPGGVATLSADGMLSAAQSRTLSLNDLMDVSASNPNLDDVLKFDGKAWMAAPEAGAIGDAFAQSHAGSGGAAHATATTAAAGFLAPADKAKLDGIEAGAQVNKVTTVAGKTGAVTLTKTDVGLGSVTNAAQLTRGASDWAAFSVKTTPAAADQLLIEDSAASGAKKRIAISALPSSGSGGEVNTASNVNTAGVGVFKQKSGVNLEFRGVKANSARVSVYSADTDTAIGIDVAEGQLRLENIGGTLKDGGAHGTQGGGSLHAVATQASSGFMTPQDKAKLDGVEAGATADQTGAEIITAIDATLGSTAWQQSWGTIGNIRAITAPESDDPAISLELPDAVNRRDFLLGFTATGAVTTTEVATAKDVDDLAVRGLTSVENIAALRQVTPRSPRCVIYVGGYEVPGDGGGGDFRWEAGSTLPADGGTVFSSSLNGNGRWIRQSRGSVSNVRWFGAKGDNSTDDSPAIQAAIDLGRPVYFPHGIYVIGSSLKCKVNGPTVLIGAMPANIHGVGTTIRDSRSSGDEPMLRSPSGWKTYDGTFRFNNGDPMSTEDDFPQINNVVLKNISFAASDANSQGSCVQLFSCTGSHIENCQFYGYRGFENGIYCHDTTIINSSASGPFVSDYDWTPPVDVADLKRACGFRISQHTYMYGCSANRCGVGIYACGNNNVIVGARVEESGFGLVIGETRDYFTGPEFLPSTRSLFSGISMEACWIGLRIAGLSESTVENIMMQGSPTNADRDYVGHVGVEVAGFNGATATIRNVTTLGQFNKAAIVNYSSSPLSGCYAVNNTSTAMKLGAAFRPLNRSDNDADPEFYHFLNTQLFPLATKERYKTITAFHDLQLPGLTGLNIRDLSGSGESQGGPVFSRNLGDTVTAPASPKTSVAVSFRGKISQGTVGFTGAKHQSDGSSTLAAGTYYYATTIICKDGEVGVNYENAAYQNYTTVVVSSGEKAVLTFGNLTSVGVRRIYRGNALGEFDGYWEVDQTSGSFEDLGTRAFDGYGAPSKGGAVPSRNEDDANYQIVATPSWNTTVWVTNKSTKGFMLNFGTPAPDANQTLTWLMFRP